MSTLSLNEDSNVNSNAGWISLLNVVVCLTIYGALTLLASSSPSRPPLFLLTTGQANALLLFSWLMGIIVLQISLRSSEKIGRGLGRLTGDILDSEIVVFGLVAIVVVVQSILYAKLIESKLIVAMFEVILMLFAALVAAGGIYRSRFQASTNNRWESALIVAATTFALQLLTYFALGVLMTL